MKLQPNPEARYTHMANLGITSKTQCCLNCRYFFRHYIQTVGKWGVYEPLDQGHCYYPRLKRREATDTCTYFEPKQ